ncbi:MAG: phosphate acyltransferase PlsX [Proteobacteria bacterium]|nr:phosphate acyltransferase PlsX [Pseudomonadota bacterium]
MKIAVDGMGGDFAPRAVVEGVELACSEKIADIVLLGDEGVIKPLIKNPEGIEIYHTPTYVEMDESPSNALRKKKDSSINKAFELMKAQKVQAVVTAGNSGAAMAFAIFTLGRLGFVDRPAIATLNPNVKGGKSILLDSGGNVDCKPINLAQFALMGDVFARCVLGIDAPRIGILSNAEEETKGNELTREAHTLIKGLGLNYIGYVEGTDIHNGSTDVVVSDGFVGNVALKVSEGVAESLMLLLKEGIEKKVRRKIGYLFMKDVLKEIAKQLDYSETGGAPLLGVDGVCIICHGKSNGKAIKNAIALAKRFVEKNLNEFIKETMQSHQSLQKKKEKKKWIIF